MSRPILFLGLVSVGLSWLSLACGGSAGGDVGGGGSGGSKASAGGSVAALGGSASGGRASGGASAGGEGGIGGDGESPVDPAPLVGPDLEANGPGACSETTLGEFLDSIHELMPELADIDSIASSPSLGDPEEEVLAFGSASGFSIALKRGSGDCPAGCIDETFWFFSAGVDCAPEYLGKYSTIYNSGGNCYDVEGTSRWGVGREVPATSRCGFDAAPQDIAGTYEVSASGLADRCSASGNDSWEGPFKFIIEQSPGDLAQGEVTFVGVSATLDDRTWPAKIAAKQVTVSFDGAESDCIDGVQIEFNYDVQLGRGSFDLLEVVAEDCDDPMSDYCKGTLDLELEK